MIFYQTRAGIADTLRSSGKIFLMSQSRLDGDVRRYYPTLTDSAGLSARMIAPENKGKK